MRLIGTALVAVSLLLVWWIVGTGRMSSRPLLVAVAVLLPAAVGLWVIFHARSYRRVMPVPGPGNAQEGREPTS